MFAVQATASVWQCQRWCRWRPHHSLLTRAQPGSVGIDNGARLLPLDDLSFCVLSGVLTGEELLQLCPLSKESKLEVKDQQQLAEEKYVAHWPIPLRRR